MAAVTICSDFGAPQNKVCHCFPYLFAMKWWDAANRPTIRQSMYALIVSNQATELIMQSRKLKAEETIYILTLWESQREPDSMETYPGGEAARAACPPLCWWSKIWLDILPSSLPIRGASGQSSLRPVSHSTKERNGPWQPSCDPKSSPTHWSHWRG